MSFLTLFTADAAAHGHEFLPACRLSPQYWKCRAMTMTEPIRRTGWSSSVLTPAQAQFPIQEEDMSENTKQHFPESPRPVALPPPTRSQKKPARTKTCYYLAQPAPGPLHRRCRAERALIVQLQRLSNASRPLPIYDVLPASAFGSKLKHIGQFFNGSGNQGVVFLSVEQYGSGSQEGDIDSDGDEDGLDSRHIVASISHEVRRKSSEDARGGTKKTVLQFSEGPRWEVTQLASGGYEFTTQDSGRRFSVAKWLPSRKRLSFNQRTQTEFEERKFQFSILDNNTKKKPVLAWLNQQSIDILDRHPGHSVPSTASSPTSTPSGSVFDVDMLSSSTGEVSEQIKEFIVVTGTWVALREGFATGGRTDESQSPRSSESPNSPSSRFKSKFLTFSNSSSGNLSSDDRSIKKLHRRRTLLGHQETTNNVDGLEATSSSIPRRAHSLGAAQAPARRVHPQTPDSMDIVSETVTASQPPLRTSSQRRPRSESVPEASSSPSPIPPSPTVGCMSRTFPGCHKVEEPISEPNSPARVAVSVDRQRSQRNSLPPLTDSSISGTKPRERRRFVLRSFFGGLFKRPSDT